MRDKRTATQSPVKSLSPARRPAITRISDSTGPSTAGPSPVDQATSVATSRSPAIRFLVPSGKLAFSIFSATSTRVSSGSVLLMPRLKWMSVSVVIPAHNAAARIGDQLEALSAQSFDGDWEVIVVDDGSTDATAEVAARWAEKLPALTVMSTPEQRGASHARNTGTARARGSLIAYCDADDVVCRGWLAGLASVLAEHDLVTGPMEGAKLNPHIRADHIFDWYWPEGARQEPRWRGYLAPVNSGNMGVTCEMFHTVHGFDETLARGQDYDFAFRVQLAGGTVGFSPDAVVSVRLLKGWSYFRRAYRDGIADVILYARFRHHGMHRRFLRGVVRLAATAMSAPLALLPWYRHRWISASGEALGRLSGSLRRRVLYL
jgi:glycosyltransferase involved in cell wall biosynthesis